MHPLGIEGAQLLALAVAHAVTSAQFDRDAFFAHLTSHCQSPEYSDKLERAARIHTAEELLSLGNGIESLESVPTAIASFALTPDSYLETIGNLILLGGDTDTLAAMAGAISGAFLGVTAIPGALIDRLEESPKGRSYILELSDRLVAIFPQADPSCLNLLRSLATGKAESRGVPRQNRRPIRSESAGNVPADISPGESPRSPQE